MKQSKTRILAALCVTAFLAGTAACGSKEASIDNVLDIQLDVEVASLDPQIATDGTSFEVISTFTEGLYLMDAGGVPTLAMASGAVLSDDGLKWTFTIRDAKWSNGDPVRAQDFVFSWTRAVNPETASEYAFIIGVAGIRNADEISAGNMPLESLGVSAPDDRTLVVELAYPVPFFTSLMTFPTFYPVNEAFFTSAGASYATSPSTVLSNGPFKLSEYSPATTSIKLAKNTDYYDAGKVALDGLAFHVIKDSNQTMLSYESGEIEVAILSGNQVASYKDNPEYMPVAAGYLWYISPNQKIAGLENENLRRAIGLSYDKDAIAYSILRDGSIPANFPVPTKLAAGPDGKDFRETSGTYFLTDKELAKTLFAAAKTELGKETFAYRMVVEDTRSAQDVATFLKSEIETNLPGLTITLEVMPKKQRVERMQNGEYEIGLTRWGPDYADPMTYLDMWTTNSPNNYGSWSSAEYDALIASCKTEVDVVKRWENLKAAEKLVMDNSVILPCYQQGYAELVKKHVSGIEFHSVGVNRIYKNAKITR